MALESELMKAVKAGKLSKGEAEEKLIAARKKIERLLGNKVHLALHVKVLKHWSSNAQHLRNLGFN